VSRSNRDAFGVAEHLRFHGGERLDGARAPYLQIARSVPDDGGETSAYVQGFLEAV